MWRYKAIPVLLAVALLSLLISLAVALAQGGSGTVVIRDSDWANKADYQAKLSDQATISLTSVPALPSDKMYEGWLVSDDGKRKESTGILKWDAEGNVNQTFWLASGDEPSGENLFAPFNTFVVTVEPVPDLDPGPSAAVAFQHTIPAGGLAHIRHLLYSMPGNPPYTAGFYKDLNVTKGITVGLREQTWLALYHAGLGVRAKTLAEVQIHACHVVNIIEGTGVGKGEHFDSTCIGIGEDGFGILSYAKDAALHFGLASQGAPQDLVIAEHSKKGIEQSNGVGSLATLARDLALQSLSKTDILAAQISSQNAEAVLTKAMDNAKGAYLEAQNMGTYTLTPPAKPVEEAKAPSVGDPNVPNMALAALLVGAVLLGSGAYIYRRSRTQRRGT